MNPAVKAGLVLLLTVMFTAGCSSHPPPQDDTFNQADSQRSRAQQAQDELAHAGLGAAAGLGLGHRQTDLLARRRLAHAQRVVEELRGFDKALRAVAACVVRQVHAQRIGIGHVAFGSDFDGVGDSLPEGMKDVSFYPNLVERFLRLEYSPADIQKVMSGNLMRVWRQAEAYAAQATAGA